MTVTVVDCSREDHVALKTSPARLRVETPAHGRPQKFDGEVLFYFRECPKCLSTLAIEPEIEAQARETD